MRKTQPKPEPKLLKMGVYIAVPSIANEDAESISIDGYEGGTSCFSSENKLLEALEKHSLDNTTYTIWFLPYGSGTPTKIGYIHSLKPVTRLEIF